MACRTSRNIDGRGDCHTRNCCKAKRLLATKIIVNHAPRSLRLGACHPCAGIVCGNTEHQSVCLLAPYNESGRLHQGIRNPGESAEQRGIQAAPTPSNSDTSLRFRACPAGGGRSRDEQNSAQSAVRISRYQTEARGGLGMADAREVMNIRQASQYLGVSPDTLYKYVSEQTIPAFKLGNRWRFKKSKLDQWMEEKSTQTQLQDK